MKNTENWKEVGANKEADATGNFGGKKVGFNLVLAPYILSPQAGVPCFPVGDGGEKECDSMWCHFKGGVDRLACRGPPVLGRWGWEEMTSHGPSNPRCSGSPWSLQGRHRAKPLQAGACRGRREKAILAPWHKPLCLMLKTFCLTCSARRRTHSQPLCTNLFKENSVFSGVNILCFVNIMN